VGIIRADHSDTGTGRPLLNIRNDFLVLTVSGSHCAAESNSVTPSFFFCDQCVALGLWTEHKSPQRSEMVNL
jgi:hypothetical protein